MKRIWANKRNGNQELAGSHQGRKQKRPQFQHNPIDQDKGPQQPWQQPKAGKLRGDTGLRDEALARRRGDFPDRRRFGEVKVHPTSSKLLAKKRPIKSPVVSIDHRAVYREHQRVAVDCGADRFISMLRVTYAADTSKSVHFAYRFIYRRKSIVLPKDPSHVAQHSCHSLKFCMGRRACLFHLSNSMCLHDPAPSKRKVSTGCKVFLPEIVTLWIMHKKHDTFVCASEIKLQSL